MIHIRAHAHTFSLHLSLSSLIEYICQPAYIVQLFILLPLPSFNAKLFSPFSFYYLSFFNFPSSLHHLSLLIVSLVLLPFFYTFTLSLSSLFLFKYILFFTHFFPTTTYTVFASSFSPFYTLRLQDTPTPPYNDNR